MKWPTHETTEKVGTLDAKPRPSHLDRNLSLGEIDGVRHTH
jgi:hypothetical protein